MKLTLGDLNPATYLPHPTSIYTCKVTITLRMCGSKTYTFSYSRQE